LPDPVQEGEGGVKNQEMPAALHAECNHGKAETKHTPTPPPWEKSGDLIVKDLSYDKTVTAAYYEIATTNIGHWTTEQKEANAAFIVRAVNAHEELLEAVKASATMTNELLRTIDDGHWYSDDLVALRVKVLQAIAKAEARS
jgi:hypothetical protein